MWSSRTSQQLCKELGVPEPQQITEDVNHIADHIYVKYFKDPDVDPVNEQKDIKHHFRTLLNMDVRTNQVNRIEPTPNDMWVFGYGSLVWKADFPYIDRKRGFICRYLRRFYQHSIDHRGTPERPGRVVTLVASDEVDDRVYGMAYRIAASDVPQVVDHLDYREKNGYQRTAVEFHEYPDGETFPVVIYIAPKDNQSYADKSQHNFHLVDEIITSAGPSGSNREYLFNLAEAMRALFPDVVDDHLFNLEEAVRQRIDEHEEDAYERALKSEISIILRSASKEDAQVGVAEAAKRFRYLRNWCEKPGSREFLVAKSFQADHKKSVNILAKNL